MIISKFGTDEIWTWFCHWNKKLNSRRLTQSHVELGVFKPLLHIGQELPAYVHERKRLPITKHKAKHERICAIVPREKCKILLEKGVRFCLFSFDDYRTACRCPRRSSIFAWTWVDFYTVWCWFLTHRWAWWACHFHRANRPDVVPSHHKSTVPSSQSWGGGVLLTSKYTSITSKTTATTPHNLNT